MLKVALNTITVTLKFTFYIWNFYEFNLAYPNIYLEQKLMSNMFRILNAICLYCRIWLVTILCKILNLKIVTMGFSWKDPSSWNVKFYMSHLQQYTKIINIPTLQTYFSLQFLKIEVYTKPKNVWSLRFKLEDFI